jgi:hypothetical protein
MVFGLLAPAYKTSVEPDEALGRADRRGYGECRYVRQRPGRADITRQERFKSGRDPQDQGVTASRPDDLQSERHPVPVPSDRQ